MEPQDESGYDFNFKQFCSKELEKPSEIDWGSDSEEDIFIKRKQQENNDAKRKKISFESEEEESPVDDDDDDDDEQQEQEEEEEEEDNYLSDRKFEKLKKKHALEIDYVSRNETASRTFGFYDATGMITGQSSFLKLAQNYESSCDELEDGDCTAKRGGGSIPLRNGDKLRFAPPGNAGAWFKRYESGEWNCLGCAYATTHMQRRTAESSQSTLLSGTPGIAAMEACVRLIEANFYRMEPLQLAKAVHRLYRRKLPNAGQPGHPPMWRTMDILVHVQICVLEPRLWIANTVRRLRQLQYTLGEMIFEKETKIPAEASRALLREIRRLQKEGGGGGDDSPGEAASTDPHSGLPLWMIEAAMPREKLKVNKEASALFMNIQREITRLLSMDPKKMLFYQSEWKLQLQQASSLLNVSADHVGR